MSTLELYCQAIKDSKGLLRQQRLQTLRRYLKESTDETLNNAIKYMLDMDLLRIIWEAGARKGIQAVVLNRIEELTIRRAKRTTQ